MSACARKSRSSILVFIVVVAAFTTAVSELCNPRDKQALLKIKKELGNPTSLSSWLPTSDCCATNWEGVTCETDNQIYRVRGLQLTQLNLSKPYPIPPSIGNLPYLDLIFISSIPNLVGPLPKTMTKLTHLRNLYIHYTGISGNVPDFLSQIKTLQVLDLAYNNFSGTLPPSLSSLPNLAEISFSDNRITGTIPSSYGSFSKNMKAMVLSSNRLTGKIPATFANLDLQIVNLWGNMMEGDASMLFGSDISTDITLGKNQFAFDLGKLSFSSQLIYLDLRENLIYGRLPKQLTKLKNLEMMNVSYNNLCGQIPQGGSLQNFDVSSYDHNKCLCGSPLPSCKY